MFWLVVSLFFAPISSKADWPAPVGFDCGYYLQINDNLQCPYSDDNYLTKFAHNYCVEFKEKSKVWNPQLTSFIESAGTCLLETLYTSRDQVNCGNVEEFGFASHARCYLKSGFCDLSGAEKLQLATTINWFMGWRQIWAVSQLIDEVSRQCFFQDYK